MEKIVAALKTTGYVVGDICTVLALVGIPIAIAVALFPEQAFNFYEMTFAQLF